MSNKIRIHTEALVVSDSSDSVALILKFQKDPNRYWAQIEERYIAYAGALIHSLEHPAYDREDLLQECRIAIYKAALNYDPRRSASPDAYIRMCVKSAVRDLGRQARRARQLPVVRLDARRNTASDDEDPETADGMEELPDAGAADDLYASVIARDVLDELLPLLTELEQKCFLLRLQQYSYDEIAERVGVQVKAVDNALLRARQKARALLTHAWIPREVHVVSQISVDLPQFQQAVAVLSRVATPRVGSQDAAHIVIEPAGDGRHVRLWTNNGTTWAEAHVDAEGKWPMPLAYDASMLAAATGTLHGERAMLTIREGGEAGKQWMEIGGGRLSPQSDLMVPQIVRPEGAPLAVIETDYDTLRAIDSTVGFVPVRGKHDAGTQGRFRSIFFHQRDDVTLAVASSGLIIAVAPVRGRFNVTGALPPCPPSDMVEVPAEGLVFVPDAIREIFSVIDREQPLTLRIWPETVEIEQGVWRIAHQQHIIPKGLAWTSIRPRYFDSAPRVLSTEVAVAQVQDFARNVLGRTTARSYTVQCRLYPGSGTLVFILRSPEGDTLSYTMGEEPSAEAAFVEFWIFPELVKSIADGFADVERIRVTVPVNGVATEAGTKVPVSTKIIAITDAAEDKDDPLRIMYVTLLLPPGLDDDVFEEVAVEGDDEGAAATEAVTADEVAEADGGFSEVDFDDFDFPEDDE